MDVFYFCRNLLIFVFNESYFYSAIYFLFANKLINKTDKKIILIHRFVFYMQPS